MGLSFELAIDKNKNSVWVKSFTQTQWVLRRPNMI